MKIVHFSDWHAHLRPLPEADLYVCTGDMLDDYPIRVPQKRKRMDGTYTDWGNEPKFSALSQLAWIDGFIAAGGFRQFLGSPDAPIVCVRGNHDFIDVGPMFAGCNLVHEFVDNELVEVLGLRITGHRGIPFIYGSWNDEVDRAVLYDRVKKMPEADIFLTHYAPSMILDSEEDLRRGVIHYGLEAMEEEIVKKAGPRAAHCFGHIHGSGGLIKTRGPGAYIGGEGDALYFSNAATAINVIDL